LDIPGLDPDRNSIQIDIFPTALIDNLVITKSFTPDLPADFTGGLVNIETKDFPDDRILDISAGVSYNPRMHFKDNFRDYEGSNTDWLGFDDGLRDIPDRARTLTTNDPLQPGEERSFKDSFSPNLAAGQENSFMNFDFSLTYGDQIGVGKDDKNNLGYIFSLTYNNSTNFYDDIIYEEWQRSPNLDETELIRLRTRDATSDSVINNQLFDPEGGVGERNYLLGGLAGLAFKTDRTKLKFNVMHLQNAVRRTGRFFVDENPNAPAGSGFIAFQDNLEFNERSVSNFFLNGEHYFDDGRWVLDWRGAYTLSGQDDPDIRIAPFDIDNLGRFRFNPGGGGTVQRLWRELDETNVTGRVDLTREMAWFGEDAKLKFGASHAFKERDYQIIVTSLTPAIGTTFSGNADDIWPLVDPDEPDVALNIQATLNLPNSNEYNSVSNNTGFYVSSEFSPTPKLKTILGVRGENFVQRHSGRDITASQSISSLVNQGFTEEEAIEQVKSDPSLGFVLDDDEVLNALDFFPSVNLIYALTENMNLRTAYSRTIARPSFKELSFAQIADPLSGWTFNGALFPTEEDISNGEIGGLNETYINNFDLRWELFLERGEILSVSGFYKQFTDPIELVRFQRLTSAQFQPQNVGDARVIGIEAEFRKNLGFLNESLSNWSLNGNVTWVDSRVDLSEEELAGRLGAARTGETIEDTRDMQGQAPYVINAGISYNNFDIGLDAGFFYNVQGETLLIIASPTFPDVFSEPFHSLNFNANKSFGEEQRFTLNISVDNILNDRREQFFQSFEAQDRVFFAFDPGVEIGIGLSYSFY
jgi:outer membrane receptor protein involved in Fe transport